MSDLFLDTNVVLDVVLGREPHVIDSSRVLQRIASGEMRGWLSSTAMTTVWYVTQRHQNRARAETAVRSLHDLLQIAPVTVTEITGGLADIASGAFSDFEDAVQHAAAEAAGAEAIVTRNVRDFHGARLPVHSPAELLAAR